jgi:hypothetical protein
MPSLITHFTKGVGYHSEKKSEQKTNHLFYIQYHGQRAKEQLLATLHLCHWG